MDMENKSGLKWLIFKWFGPQEVQNLINYIDNMNDLPESSGAIAIYPLGEFHFSVKTSNEDDLEPLIFPTPQERASFQVGLSYGVGLMGGTTASLTKEDYDIIDEMKRGSTGRGSKKIH